MPNKNPRQIELGKIHMGAKQLGIGKDQDLDAYQAMLWTAARVKSAGELSPQGRQKVIAHLKSRGAKFTRPRQNYQHRNPVSKQRQLSKIEETKIQALLVVLEAPWRYADSIAKRMYQVDSVHFCNKTQLNGVITALNKRAQNLLIKTLPIHFDPDFGVSNWGQAKLKAISRGYITHQAELDNNVQAMHQLKQWLEQQTATREAQETRQAQQPTRDIINQHMSQHASQTPKR
jgi:phage gp16-like protein